MTRLGDALREKYRDPRDVIRTLGLDAALLDQKGKNMPKPTKFANTALQLTAAAIKPLLAKDAKINLMPVFKDVTAKNFKAQKIKIALDAALKGKLAKDADPHMGHVVKLLDAIEGTSSNVADESVSESQHNAMEAAAHGESNLGIPEKVGKDFEKADKGKTFDAEPFKAFLKEKGMSEDDIMKACDMMPKPAMDDEEVDEDEKEKDASFEGVKDPANDASFEKDKEEDSAKEGEAKDKAAKDAEIKAAKDKAAKDEAEKKAKDSMKDMVSKGAMDAAIKAATDATVKRVTETARQIRIALDEVRPWVGEIPATMAFDSAEQVRRHALKMMGVDGAEEIHESALSKIISLHPKPGARPAERGGDSGEQLGMDEAAKDRLSKRYPGIDRIVVQ